MTADTDTVEDFAILATKTGIIITLLLAITFQDCTEVFVKSSHITFNRRQIRSSTIEVHHGLVSLPCRIASPKQASHLFAWGLTVLSVWHVCLSFHPGREEGQYGAAEPEECADEAEGLCGSPAGVIGLSHALSPSVPVLVAVEFDQGSEGREEGQREEQVDHGQEPRDDVVDPGEYVRHGDRQAGNDLGVD